MNGTETVPSYEPQGVEVDYVATLTGDLFKVTEESTGGGCTAVLVRPSHRLLDVHPEYQDLRLLVTDWRAAVPSRDDDEVTVGVYRWDEDDPGYCWADLGELVNLSPAPEQAAAQVLALLAQAVAR